MKNNVAEDEWTLREIILRQYPRCSNQALMALEQAATAWTCLKKEVIVEQGQLCPEWIFVAKGLHRIMFMKNGKVDTLFFDGGGAIFTSFHSIIAGKAGIFRLEALSDSYGWKIEHRNWLRLQERHPDLMRVELHCLRHQFYSLEDYYLRRALSTPRERYDTFWSKRSKILEYLSPYVLSRHIPLKVIAQYLSMTPQMLSILRRREMEAYKIKSAGKFSDADGRQEGENAE